MKRDMDLIRALLLKVEGEEPQDLSCWTEGRQVEHMALLVEAHLVHGEIIFDSQGDVRSVLYTRLTWDGHEFLASARDANIWMQTKEKIRTIGSSAAWPVLTAIMTDLVKKQIGI